MSKNEIIEINVLPPIEIDPDYERQIADELDPKNQPARITTKKAWFMSLFLPVLSILASAAAAIVDPFVFVLIVPLGLICGGIIPTVMIVRDRIDTSKYFIGKMILFAVLVAAAVFSWISSLNIWTWIAEGFHFLLLPAVMITAEIIFAAVQKTDVKTKVCLALSSAAWVYLGFTLGYAIVFGPLLL